MKKIIIFLLMILLIGSVLAYETNTGYQRTDSNVQVTSGMDKDYNQTSEPDKTEEMPIYIHITEEPTKEGIVRTRVIQTLTTSQVQQVQPKFRYENQEMVSEQIKENIESKQADIDEPTKTHRFAVQLEAEPSFEYETVKRIGDSDIYIIDVENKEIRNMAKDNAVAKFGDESSVKRFAEYAKEELKEEFKEEARERKLERTRGVENIETIEEEVQQEVEVMIQEDIIEPKPDKLSYYQYFITPDDPEVKKNAIGKSPEQVYNYVADTIWISDKSLFGISEKWVLPKDFLLSLAMPENPTDRLVSDCSEKANTLVSLMRASGLSSNNIRVVLGKVDFGGSIGGHAWAEYYDGDQWIALEPSSGPYFDDAERKTINRNYLPFDYFSIYEYPVVEVYYRYNDKYFEDLSDGESNAPDNWAAFATTRLEGNITEGFESQTSITIVFYLLVLFLIGYFIAKKK